MTQLCSMINHHFLWHFKEFSTDDGISMIFVLFRVILLRLCFCVPFSMFKTTQTIFDWNLDKILFCDFGVKIPFQDYDDYFLFLVFFALLKSINAPLVGLECATNATGGCDRAIKMN